MLVGSIFLCNTPARPRVQRAPGLPHALYLSRANEMQNFGRDAPREYERMSNHVIARSVATRQSIVPHKERMDCFALLSCTNALRLLQTMTISGAPFVCRQNRLLTNFDSFNPYRHGRPAALVIPIRNPVTISGLLTRACSANGGASSGSSLCAMVMPSASQSLPGPEHSERSSCRPRRRRIAGMPWVGSSARISTALAEPAFSQTKLTHQWMP